MFHLTHKNTNMKTTIKTNKSESTLTIKENFDVILDENFSAVCKAIDNRGVALNELQSLFEKNENILEEIIKIIRHATYDPSNDLCLKLRISEPTASYILSLPLSTLTSIDSKYCKKKCDEYKRLVESLSV